TGLLRCYVSRVENGHTVPAVETLEKFARALELPLYQLIYDGNETPAPLKLGSPRQVGWGESGKEAAYLSKLRKQLARMTVEDRQLFLHLAQKIGMRKRSNGQ